MPVGDIFRVRIACQSVAQGSINVLHYRLASLGAGTGQPSVTEIATQLDAHWFLSFKALVDDAHQYRGTGVQLIFPPPPAVEGTATANAGAGHVVGGDALPKQVAGLISWRTAFAGRRYRGRSFIPFPGESDNSEQQVPTAGYVTRLATLAGKIAIPPLITSISGANANLELVIWHRDSSTYTPVNNYIVRSFWATQRRRGDFGRPNAAPF